ncbi:Stress response protein nst1 [Bienertia sinuspersici]
MKNSQFYQFLNVKDKATSSFLVHKFLQCYKVDEKHFEVNQKVVTIDVSDIVRMTGLKASGDQYEKSKSQNIPSWYVDLVDKYPPPTKEKKAEKNKKEEAMEKKEEEKEEKKEEEKEEEEEEKGKGEAEKKNLA